MKKIFIGALDGHTHHSRNDIAAAFGAEYTETLKTKDSLLGASLLLDMLRYVHIRPGRDTLIKRGGNGKPYFYRKRRINFSISHSHGVAICAISDNSACIGADIEICPLGEAHTSADRNDNDAAARRKKLAERWLIPRGFSPVDYICKSCKSDDLTCDLLAFTKAWTAFESASKYTGGTLADCHGLPYGTVISQFDIQLPNRSGAVAICHNAETMIIPCPEFYTVTQGVPRVKVLNVEFDPITRREAANRAASHIMNGEGLFTVVTPNPVISMNCRRDPKLMAAVNSASLSVADGRGVTDAAKRQGTPLPERVCGIDLAEDILTAAAAHGWRVFLLGGAPGRAIEAAKNLTSTHTGLTVCGTLDGYGEIADFERVEKALLTSAPDILFVCLGSPRQEMMIFDHTAALSAAGVRLAAALGGSIDVWSGHVRRAPSFVIKARCEWLWRCMCEPRRLRVIPTLIKYRMLTK